jgi:outer membrane lipoprotein-sorting protein
MRLAIALALTLCAGPAAAGLSGADIIAQMEMRRVQGDDAVSVLDVTLVSSGGARTTRTVATYRKHCGDDWRILSVVREPADVAGTGLLSWIHPDRSPDMWLYLPELGRIRQLNAFAQAETFMGSDLTYEDLTGQVFHARTHALVGEEDVDDEPTYRVESLRTSDLDGYARIVTWVSRQTFMPVRIEYYDRDSRLEKLGAFRDVREVKGIFTPAAITMENVQTGHRTEIAVREVDFGRALQCDLFTRRRLTRVP